MKKIELKNFVDYIENLKKIIDHEIRVADVGKVISYLLDNPTNNKLEIYLIPGFGGHALMVYCNPVNMQPIFEFIEIPLSVVVNSIPTEHIDRLYLYADNIFMLIE